MDKKFLCFCGQEATLKPIDVHFICPKCNKEYRHVDGRVELHSSNRMAPTEADSHIQIKSSTSSEPHSLKYAFVGAQFLRPFFELRDRLDASSLSAIRHWQLKRLCDPAELQLPADCLSLTVEEFLATDPSLIVVKSAVGKGGFRKLITLLNYTEEAFDRHNDTKKTKTSRSTSDVETQHTTISTSEYSVRLRWHAIRTAFHDGRLETIENYPFRSLTRPTDKHLPRQFNDLSIRQLLSRDYDELIQTRGVGAKRIINVLEVFERQIQRASADVETQHTTISTSEYSVRLRWHAIRTAFHDGRLETIENHPFRSLTRPTDKHLPRQFNDLSIRQLLSRDFYELIQTRGVGAKRIINVLEVLERQIQRVSTSIAPALPGNVTAPIPKINELQSQDEGFTETDLAEKHTEADASLVADCRSWDTELSRIVEFGFGLIKVGRVAPSLKMLSRELWSRRFSEYTGLSERQVSNLQGHGPHSAQELKHVVATVSKALPAALHPCLTVTLTSRKTLLIHEILLEFIQLDNVDTSEIGEFLDLIEQQLSDDLEGDASKVAIEFIWARESRDATSALLETGHNLGVTPKYIWSSLELVNSVFHVRWPEGHQLLSLFKLKLEKANNNTAERLIGAIIDTLYTGAPKHPPQVAGTPSSSGNPTSGIGDLANSGISLAVYLTDVLVVKPMGLVFEQIVKELSLRGYDSTSHYNQNVIYQCLHSEKELFRRSAGGRYFYIGSVDSAKLADKGDHQVTGTTREKPNTGIQQTSFPQSRDTVPPGRRSPPKSGKDGNAGVPLMAYLIDVLRNKPMGLRLDAIAKEVMSRGYETKSHYFANVVYQCLHRSKELFKGIDGGRYVYIGSTDQSDMVIFKSQNDQESNIAQSAADLPDDPLLNFLDLPEQ